MKLFNLDTTETSIIVVIIALVVFVSYSEPFAAAQSAKNWDTAQQIQCQDKGGVFMLDMTHKHKNVCQFG